MDDLQPYPDPEACAPTERDLEHTIYVLKQRLAQRNYVMDIIRTAYHRDILNNYGLSSIDLRPAISLFAPHGGELYRKACSLCGGALEIRIKKKKVPNNRSQSQMKALQADNVALQQKAQKNSLHLSEVIEKYNHDMNLMIKTISSLSGDAIKCIQFQKKIDFLQSSLNQSRKQLRDYDNIKNCNVVLNQKAARALFTIEDLYQLLYYESLRKVRVNEENSKLKGSLETSKNELDEVQTRLNATLLNLEEIKSNLKSSEESNERTQKRYLETCEQIHDLERTLSSVKQKNTRALNQMELCQNGLNKEVRDLREDRDHKQVEIESATKEIERLLDIEQLYMKEALRIPSNDTIEISNSNTPQNETASIINEVDKQLHTYSEHAEKNIEELVKFYHRISTDNQTIHKRNLYAYSNLKKDHWTSMEVFKMDQSKVLNSLIQQHGGLVEALQKQFKQIEKDKRSEKEAIKGEISELSKHFSEKEQSLLKNLKDTEDSLKIEQHTVSKLSKYNETIENESRQIKGKYKDLRMQYDNKLGAVLDLKTELNSLQNNFEESITIVERNKTQLNHLKETLMHKEETIRHCETEIEDLTKELSQANSRYKSEIEKERTRLQTNKDFGLQAIPQREDASIGVDFLRPRSSLFMPKPLTPKPHSLPNTIPTKRVCTASGRDRGKLTGYNFKPQRAPSISSKEIRIEINDGHDNLL